MIELATRLDGWSREDRVSVNTDHSLNIDID